MAQTVATGPPGLDLDRRKLLLESLRGELDWCGLGLEAIRGGFRYRVIAHDEQATARLIADEAVADANGHWWVRDAVWRSVDGTTTVVYAHDPDGNDISFQGWGPGSAECLSRLDLVLSAHHQ